MSITQSRLKHWIHYNPDSGEFTWKRKPNKRMVIGQRAGCWSRRYLRIKLDGTPHAAARLAFLYMTGMLPRGDMDHVDGNSENNRWVNLRDVTTAENIQNQRRPQKRNRTGFLGVGISPSGKYRSRISVDGKEHGLGWHPTAEAAHHAYVTAKRKLHSGGVL